MEAAGIVLSLATRGKYQTPLVRPKAKVLKNQASRRGLGWGEHRPAMREKGEVGVSLGQPKPALCSLPGPREMSPGPGPPPAPSEPRSFQAGAEREYFFRFSVWEEADGRESWRQLAAASEVGVAEDTL